jgi:hypothetical protein
MSRTLEKARMRSVRLNGTSSFARPLIALAFALAIAGCGSSTDVTSGGGLGDITGTYTLRRLDSKLLPFTFSNGADTVVVEIATFNLNHDGMYSVLATGSVGSQRGTVFADDGDYSLSQSTLTFTSNTVGGLAYSANATPGTFTVSLPGSFVQPGAADFQGYFVRGGALPQ